MSVTYDSMCDDVPDDWRCHRFTARAETLEPRVSAFAQGIGTRNGSQLNASFFFSLSLSEKSISAEIYIVESRLALLKEIRI